MNRQHFRLHNGQFVDETLAVRGPGYDFRLIVLTILFVAAMGLHALVVVRWHFDWRDVVQTRGQRSGRLVRQCHGK